MPTYQYVAVDEKGKTRKGVIAAESLSEARRNLQGQALFPLNLDETVAAEKGRRQLLPFFSRRGAAIGARDLALVTRQMATMIGAGISVDETLQSIAMQNTKPVIREVLTNIRSQVVEGKKLSESMRREPASFGALYVAMITAGEASGDLAEILDRVASYGEKTQAVRDRVRAALVYPAVLAIVALGVLTLLITVVVPKIAGQFDTFQTQLPLPTRLVLGLSDMLTSYGPVLAVLLLGGIFLLRQRWRDEACRLRLDSRLLSLPVLGKFIQTVNSARLARTLGTLIEGGSPALEALNAARETQTNLRLRQAVDEIYSDVYEGRALARAFRTSEVFSPLLIYMVGIGEKSGTLAHLLMKTADYLEQEIEGWTQSMLNLLEPVIVVIMGLLVGLIVMAIMLPIMQLNSLILS
ncbi:MAG: Type II secretion system protein F [Alphaproteobacteria bacterium]|nr:MAG: Type II secretion system protein F [Alphaproteobacteria bacterium]